MKKTITILIIVLLILVSGVILFKKKLMTNVTVTTTVTNPSDKTPSNVTTPVTNNPLTDEAQITPIKNLIGSFLNGTTVHVAGTVEIALESYCKNEIYLKDQTGFIRLEMKGGNLNEYVGKTVEITGIYELDNCEALCICGRKITVTEIK